MVPQAPGGLDWARRIELVSVLLASLVAVVGLWYSGVQSQQANEQARQDRALTKEGQITDRYTAAVGNLGDGAMDVRLGGVYALQRIMKDSPRDHSTIGNVLAAYVRTHTAKPSAKCENVPADVYAAVTVLATRDPARDEDFRPDLHDAQLPRLELVSRYALRQVLSPAKGNLHGVSLGGANLAGAKLNLASLNGADLTGAKLNAVSLNGADLTGADLSGADLSDADLVDADLSGADLSGAILMDTDLKRTEMTDADLRGLDLSAAFNLSMEQVDSAHFDKKTVLPTPIMQIQPSKAEKTSEAWWTECLPR